jgi:hypothetical protein
MTPSLPAWKRMSKSFTSSVNVVSVSSSSRLSRKNYGEVRLGLHPWGRDITLHCSKASICRWTILVSLSNPFSTVICLSFFPLIVLLRDVLAPLPSPPDNLSSRLFSF